MDETVVEDSDEEAIFFANIRQFYNQQIGNPRSEETRSPDDK